MKAALFKGGSGLNSAVWGKEPPVCLPVDEWPCYKPSMAARPAFTSLVTRHGIKSFHLFNTSLWHSFVSLLNGILVACIDIVYGVCGSGGLLNFDSYRLKQTLKEQSWWSNQYLLPSPHLRSKATSIEAKMLLTFSNGK